MSPFSVSLLVPESARRLGEALEGDDVCEGSRLREADKDYEERTTDENETARA